MEGVVKVAKDRLGQSEEFRRHITEPYFKLKIQICLMHYKTETNVAGQV